MCVIAVVMCVGAEIVCVCSTCMGMSCAARV